MKVKLEVEVS